jgi:dynein heavy chain
MYNLLDTYLPEFIDKEEMDPSTILDKDWVQLVKQAVTIRNDQQGQQAEFKKDLIQGITSLVLDVEEFSENFEKNGPKVQGIDPREALNRLRMFADEYSIRKRKYESYHAGEKLFGLPHQSYPELVKTAQELELLEKLYNLYQKVKDTIAKW